MIEKLIEQCRASGDFAALVEQVPYAHYIGVELEEQAAGTFFRLPPKESNLGNPVLPALHGGVIAGFMEHSAIIFLLMQLKEPKIPKTVDFSIDYLRTGKYQDTFAECHITRQGRRVANVQVNCWQEDKASMIATARAHFLLSASPGA